MKIQYISLEGVYEVNECRRQKAGSTLPSKEKEWAFIYLQMQAGTVRTKLKCMGWGENIERVGRLRVRQTSLCNLGTRANIANCGYRQYQDVVRRHTSVIVLTEVQHKKLLVTY